MNPTAPLMHESLTIEPEPAAWERLLKEARIDERARTLRAQLGLATDHPIVMTGHQPIAFHPGILAKYAAAQAAGRAFGAQAVQLVADQDVVEPLTLRRPTREADGSLRDELVSLGERRGEDAPAHLGGDVPEGMRRPVEIPPRGDAFGAFADALAQHAWADSLGAQSAEAVMELLSPWIVRTPMVYATRLHETSLFNELVDRMDDDPEACARAYNDALVAVGHTHTRALEIDAGRVELPLWWVRFGEPRGGVYSDQLADIPREELAPKALTMTGLVRTAACDVFIHGTGGAAYDQATEVWFGAWLGWDLCPAACVTATRMLALGVPVTTDADVARSVWRAHHAQHEPGMLGDKAAAVRKGELVEAIRQALGEGESPAPLFDELQALLRDVRTRHADALGQLRAKANEAKRHAAQSRIAGDRTWSFALHTDETIGGLVEEIESAFAPVACGRAGGC